ncbi:MAG: lipopolysaccharide biosynthesis protein [Sulfuricaulis sp.]|uniref:oligosaccharide flippase family protein n=1 Tax=Sulfuricaulis sp. TaxID=2003553 RepID=UPI0034A139BB
MLFRHSALYLLARGFPAVINLLAIALYTRLLGTDEYGQYAIVIAAVSLLNAVFFSWLILGVERFLPAHSGSNQELFEAVAHVFLWLVGLTAILGGVLVLYFRQDQTLRWLIGLGVVMLWVQAWFELNLAVARSKFAPLRYGAISALKAGIALGLGTILIALGYGTTGALLGLLAGLFLASVSFGWGEWIGVRLRRVDRRVLLNLGSYGFPLTILFFLNFLVSSSDRFLLGYLMSVGAAGVYAAGYDLAQQSVGLLMSVVNLAASPLIVRAMEDGGADAARERLRKSAFLLLGIAVPAVTGLCMLSDNIGNVILGKAFSKDASLVIPLIAVAVLLSGIKSFYVDLGFQLARATHRLLWSVMGAALANILLNLWWIPLFGLVGAAYATIAAFAVGLGASMLLVRKVFVVPMPPRDTYKLLLASAVMALSLWPIISFRGPIALVMQVICGATVYIFFLWLLNAGGFRKKVGAFVERKWKYA